MLNVKKLLTKILTRLTATTYTITTSQSSYLSETATVYKYGDIAIVYVPGVTGLATANTAYTLFSLPSDCIPARNVNINAYSPSASNDARTVRIGVSNNGDVTAYNYSSVTGTMNIRALLVYKTT